MVKYFIICPLVFLAGFIDAIAGGGGLISLPAFMFAGLPVHNAIATNKMSSSMGTTIATVKYARKGYIRFRLVLPSVLMAMLGSSVGAQIALRVSDAGFRYFMMAALPIVAFYVLRGAKLSEAREPYSEKLTMLLSAGIALVIGIYDGFYGPGTGTFLILLLTGIAHMELTGANGTTKAINLSTNYAALTVYLLSGKTLILMGLVAGSFNIAGNYLGATCFEKVGARSVKPIMLLVLVLFFIKIVFQL